MADEMLIRRILAEKLGMDELKVVPSAILVEDLGADSLDQIEIIMALEDEFDIEIADEDAEKLRTVKDVVKYVQDKT